MKFTEGPEKIQHIIRMFNTNVDGTKRVTEALTAIRGIGRRFADAVCKRSNVDIRKRAGELTESELVALQETISNPESKDIPQWMLNHRRDIVDGTSSQLIANQLDAYFRLHIERGKRMRHVRVCRLASGKKVRGQRTKSNGRGGVSVGVSRRK
jgi:small subunit ribosomal protein S18e